MSDYPAWMQRVVRLHGPIPRSQYRLLRKLHREDFSPRAAARELRSGRTD